MEGNVQYEDITKYVQSSEECQRRKRIRFEEPLHPTWSTIVWEKVGIDVGYMPASLEGYEFIVFAKEGKFGLGCAFAKFLSPALDETRVLTTGPVMQTSHSPPLEVNISLES